MTKKSYSFSWSLFYGQHHGKIEAHCMSDNLKTNNSFFIIYKLMKQENIYGITCIFQKVLFSLVKNIKSVIQLVKNINFWMTSTFFHKFPLLLFCHTSEFQMFVTSLLVNKNIKCGYAFS